MIANTICRILGNRRRLRYYFNKTLNLSFDKAIALADFARPEAKQAIYDALKALDIREHKQYIDRNG